MIEKALAWFYARKGRVFTQWKVEMVQIRMTAQVLYITL